MPRWWRWIPARLWSAAKPRGAPAGPRSNETPLSSIVFLKPRRKRSVGRTAIPISCSCEFLRPASPRHQLRPHRKCCEQLHRTSDKRFPPARRPREFRDEICATGPDRGDTCLSDFGPSGFCFDLPGKCGNIRRSYEPNCPAGFSLALPALCPRGRSARPSQGAHTRR